LKLYALKNFSLAALRKIAALKMVRIAMGQQLTVHRSTALALMLSSLGPQFVGFAKARGTPSPAAPSFHHSVVPAEDTNAILHNPGMGWVVYENYPIDQGPAWQLDHGDVAGGRFSGGDAVAVMFFLARH